MKKLIAFFLISVLLFTAVACACGTNTAVQTARGELSIAYDKAVTGELLAYFQANQACTAKGVLLDAETDYAALSEQASVALLKDETIAEQLKAAGWTDAENWTDAQKKANENLFGFIVLTAPTVTESSARATKLLTDWLVGDGTYDRTITTVSGSCGCSRQQTTVTIKSDAPELAKNERFQELVNP